jgi:hypothetical protein
MLKTVLTAYRSLRTCRTPYYPKPLLGGYLDFGGRL